jgi:glucuronokinase
MVMTARSAGAAAKFAGSGGAIVGMYEDEAQFAALTAALDMIGCRTIRPKIAQNADESGELATDSPWRKS